MNTDPAATQAALRAFFAQLAAGGIAHVAVSPGSRSTPLTVAADRTDGLDLSIHLDERAGAFFALGLARTTRRPVALACTSGTAAANYLPAVVEAFHSGVPLIVITADRPPELQGRGAPQTIDQQNLYGTHVRRFVEAPVAGTEPPEAAAALAVSLLGVALGTAPGPVHLNWPFREPLEPPDEDPAPFDLLAVPAPATRLAPPALPDTPRGLLVAGPMDLDDAGIATVADLAARTGWPVVADPASGLRCGPHVETTPVLACGEHLLRAPWADRHVPDAVVQLGAMPTSKAYRLWLERTRPATVITVDHLGRHPDAALAVTARIDHEPGAWAASVGAPAHGTTDWTSDWTTADRTVAGAIGELIADAPFDEPSVVAAIDAPVGPLNLVVANSMPIRDLDAFLPASTRPLRVVANRGANGIDGQASTAIGVAVGSPDPTVLLTGDLTLLHDLSGLTAATRLGADLTIVVVDNDGGGIFSFLPIVDSPTVDHHRLFHTPHGLDLAHIAPLCGASYHRATDRASLDSALAATVGRPGLHIVHVPVDAGTNVRLHREAAIVSASVLEVGP
ncbi:MAG: 2-succinyl-5-enolpyruvyl-6-hydroxy-3-cyclohexene-1-carboxylic-acid synthase [Acidimicrobiales bacterium]|nr:2-succinyl-5-enolpyruvyl-6-hydroxy-3-cyclohexene-1-carboxylic-acid synthase [Acidimicrobiales bacterium]